MNNGGYVLIDFTGCDLSDLGELPGIYNKVSAAVETGKPIVVGGIKNGTQAFTPITSYGGRESATSVFLSFFPITLHISNEDVISM